MNGLIVPIVDNTNGFGKATSVALQSNIVERVKEGELNPLMVAAELKCLINACEGVLDGIKDNVLSAAEDYNEKVFNAFGVKFEKKEVGVKYDYSDDPEWQALNREVVGATAQRKAREDVMKKMNMAHKTSTSSVAITLV